MHNFVKWQFWTSIPDWQSWRIGWSWLSTKHVTWTCQMSVPKCMRWSKSWYPQCCKPEMTMNVPKQHWWLMILVAENKKHKCHDDNQCRKLVAQLLSCWICSHTVPTIVNSYNITFVCHREWHHLICGRRYAISTTFTINMSNPSRWSLCTACT